MTAVMMGIDPHKGSHTAVAIDAGEVPLGRVRICDYPDQAVQLLARAWPDRTWAAGGATGLGGTCWPSSWSPLASGCWTCSPSWPSSTPTSSWAAP